MWPKTVLVSMQKQNTNTYKMKKFYFIMTIFLIPVIWSCSTKKLTEFKGSTNELKVIEADCLKSYFERNASTQIQSELSKEELVQVLSQLNINYNGDHIEDKLDVLLSKTNEGTKVSFQGKGTAGYSENSNTQISVLRKDIISHTDSLVQTLTIQQNQNFEQFVNDWNIKNKEVESKTFTPMMWLIIGLALIVGMFLSWISKKIKPLIKWL